MPVQFHPPASGGELAVDALLRQVDGGDGVFLFVLKRPDRVVADDPGYAPKFTPGLLAAMAEAERAEVASNCAGRYRDGEVCGLDFNPVTCAQDVPDSGRLYRLDAASSGVEVISAIWADRTDSGATYRMVQKDGMWKLDGVACHPGPRFNMP